MRMTIFVMLRALPSWLALEREARDRIAGEALGAGLADSAVSMRFFDAEAFNGTCSDIAVFEAEEPAQWYFAFERLRDSALFATPYFEVRDIIPAYEDGYRQFEASLTAN